MLLAIDIGNTSIHNGIFDRKKLKKTFRVPTHSGDIYHYYSGRLKDVDSVIIASVVPQVTKKVEDSVRRILKIKPLVVGRDIDSGIKNLYRKPEQVGSDRLVNAIAAYELYGGECIVADFGTAITIDIVNKKKEYLGGVIAPGPEISLWALSQRTALLPKVDLKKLVGAGRDLPLLGKETKESMLIGAVYGFSSLCDGIVSKLKKRYARNAKVIATGGFSKIIGPYCDSVDKIDPNLTLKGLEIIHTKNSYV